MHDWVKVYDGPLVSWICSNCNFQWHQSKKPHPQFRFWYGSTPHQKVPMTCDEWVASKVMDS